MIQRLGILLIVSLFAVTPASAVRPRTDDSLTVILKDQKQEIGHLYEGDDVLGVTDVRCLAVHPDGSLYAGTDKGLMTQSDGRWTIQSSLSEGSVLDLDSDANALFALTTTGVFSIGNGTSNPVVEFKDGKEEFSTLAAGPSLVIGGKNGLFTVVDGKLQPVAKLNEGLGTDLTIQGLDWGPDGFVAVAAKSGLYLGQPDGEWSRLFPSEGDRSWAPVDVRAVGFDANGSLWFASPQGAGVFDGKWKLFTGEEGLPYNDFTSIAFSPNGHVWFGTKIGAIRYEGDRWSYRQSRRWIPNDEVRDVAVTASGDAWFATPGGMGRIEMKAMTLAEKARHFEDEIDKYHRRTPYGYVLEANLKSPGDKSEWSNHDSDNDGLWTAMYAAGECFAYGATKDPYFKKRATDGFRALAFLSEVTQGGSHSAPPGFPARSILPTSGHDPNESHYTWENDVEKKKEDGYWKVLIPRWPVSEDGQWYWKTDTSSDELDGHYFFYALYHDLVAENEAEKEEVREVVRRITDHLVDHEFQLVDWDGTPTRWARFSPGEVNHDTGWRDERGLNSLSMLSYLKVAEHITKDPKYREAYYELIEDHHYATNLMFPKVHFGPGTGNQSDDEMAFMSYYSLIKYETDPKLRSQYAYSLASYFRLEQPELNPFFHYVYAYGCDGEAMDDPFGKYALSPDRKVVEEAADSLVRIPVNRINWRLENSHRLDIIPLWDPTESRRSRGRGYLRSGTVLPMDEQYIQHWNHGPWSLNQGGGGTDLGDGAVYLLPYYMGLYHGYLREE